MQAECEAKFGAFPEIFQCTYEEVVARNPAILKDARAKLYLLTGEQLALNVAEGKITTLEAKVAWQRLYVELKSAKDQEVAATFDAIAKNLQAARAIRQPLPSQSVSCTSTKIGGSVYTTCR